MFLKFKSGQYYAVIYNNRRKEWHGTGTNEREKAQRIGAQLEEDLKGKKATPVQIDGESVNLPEFAQDAINRIIKHFPNIAKSRIVESILLEGLEAVENQRFLSGNRIDMQDAMQTLHELSSIKREKFFRSTEVDKKY